MILSRHTGTPGRFEKGMKVKVARTGRVVTLAAPQRMFANERRWVGRWVLACCKMSLAVALSAMVRALISLLMISLLMISLY